MATLAEKSTVVKLTPPWYFNTRQDATQKTKDFITWWDTILAQRVADEESLRKLILTPWLFTFPDTPRNPWLNYLLSTYGFAFFGGTNAQAAALYKMVSGSWSTSAIQNFALCLGALALPPFEWIDVGFIPRVTAGIFEPSIADTGFIVFSSDASPAAPANVTYTPRQWVAPSGWTRSPASAVWYARGYLSGGDIVWCTKQLTNDPAYPSTGGVPPFYFSADVPFAIPSAGVLCVVDDDGTGDRRAIYYSDGSAWRKTSTPNADLGLVDPTGPRPIPEAVTVWAPNPATINYALTSQKPPPSDGFTQGYGTFSTFGNLSTFSGELELQVKLLTENPVALATLIAVLRRIKPANFVLRVRLVHVDDSVETIFISDLREAP